MYSNYPKICIHDDTYCPLELIPIMSKIWTKSYSWSISTEMFIQKFKICTVEYTSIFQDRNVRDEPTKIVITINGKSFHV